MVCVFSAMPSFIILSGISDLYCVKFLLYMINKHSKCHIIYQEKTSMEIGTNSFYIVINECLRPIK